MRWDVRRLQAAQEVEVELAEERAAERAEAEAEGTRVKVSYLMANVWWWRCHFFPAND